MSYRTILLLTITLATATSAVEEWPRWRGPRGDGISRETGLLDKWPQDGPTKVWTAKVGLGYSSPIASDGKIFLLSQDGDKDVLRCFDAETGKVLWSQSAAGGYPNTDYPGARATPTIDGKLIYTHGGGGDLVCRDLATGAIVWQQNMLHLTGSKLLQWGQASSPLVTDKSIYVQAGDGGPIAVALDKTTGQVQWKSELTGKAGYAAPVIVNVADAPQLLVFSADALTGMDPASGKTLWTEKWVTDYGVNASTPIVDGDKVFITSGYNHGSAQFQISAAGAKQVWADKDVLCKINAPVLDGGLLYCNSEDHSGTLKCVDWKTGAVKWSATKGGRTMKLGFGGSFVRDGDQLYAISQNGLLSLMKATPEGISLISQAQIFDKDFDKVWSTPLIYRGKLYAKGQDELVCLKISGGAGAAQ